MNNKAHLRPKDYDSNGDIIPMACKEEKGDLISREALKERLKEMFDTFDVILFDDIIATIDNAPTVNKYIHIDDVYRLIAGHSDYHGDNILSAFTCLAEGKEVRPIKPIEDTKGGAE